MQPAPKAPLKSILISEIRGISEALQEAKVQRYKTRIEMWFSPLHDICGFKARTMTVLDYVILERSGALIGKPLEPTREQICRFLWIMSPERKWWDDHPFLSRHFPTLRNFSCFRHGVKVGDVVGLGEEHSEPVVLAIYSYMETMFEDQPAYCAKGKESPSVYLASWFDRLRSQYACSLEECWNMPLPQLFQSLKAINCRLYPEVPSADNSSAKIMSKVFEALKNGATFEDLRSGRVAFDN
jgi:hypothetical protein